LHSYNEKKEEKKLIKYDIYKNFTYLLYFNELKRIQDDFSDVLYDKWDLSVDENDIYDYQNIE
jgi:hypothetical protein